jgi:predicted signal transduction protein with EAL and GGDEF domain
VGWSFLLAWVIYALTTAVLIGVINGLLTVNFWTLHSFQFGATIDMLVFMHVLSLGTKAVHRAAQHASQERDAMHSLAHSDPLTGLANRRSLNTQLAAALARCGPNNLVALYLLDLDGFKPVNDQHGHDVGDQLLIAVAGRLQSTMRSGDVGARRARAGGRPRAEGARRRQRKLRAESAPLQDQPDHRLRAGPA